MFQRIAFEEAGILSACLSNHFYRKSSVFRVRLGKITTLISSPYEDSSPFRLPLP
jgi:hypothetical protein